MTFLGTIEIYPRSWWRFFLRTFCLGLVTVALIIFTQDFQVNPELLISIGRDQNSPATVPDEVESNFISTKDGEQIEIWTPLRSDSQRKPLILFHGNGNNLENFYSIQKAFLSTGYRAYSFDYRGYGRSSGWPSEKGLYLDTEAVLDFVAAKEATSHDQIALVGMSLGTGFAAYAASKYRSQELVLLSPYSNLKQVVRDRGLFFRMLAPYLWYEIPNNSFVEKIAPEACVIIAHGKKDTVIPYTHSLALRNKLMSLPNFYLMLSDNSNHNDLIGNILTDLITQMKKCEKGATPAGNPN